MPTKRTRRSRHRNSVAELERIWSAGEPPPKWAFVPDAEVNDAIGGLVFFGEGKVYGYDGRRQPHSERWFRAMKASTPPVESAP